MKRLSHVLGLTYLAALLIVSPSDAQVIGSFKSITNGDQLVKGHFQPVFRPPPTVGAGTAASPRTEYWISLVTFSEVFGSQGVGEIWQCRNIDQAVARGFNPVPLL